MKGQCLAKAKVNDLVFEAAFIVVEVSTQYPLFGRDWISQLGFDVSPLIQEATQIHNTSEVVVTAERLCSEYSEVFTDELGVLPVNVITYHLATPSGEPSLLHTSSDDCFTSSNQLIKEGFGKCSGPHLPHVR